MGGKSGKILAVRIHLNEGDRSVLDLNLKYCHGQERVAWVFSSGDSTSGCGSKYSPDSCSGNLFRKEVDNEKQECSDPSQIFKKCVIQHPTKSETLNSMSDYSDNVSEEVNSGNDCLNEQFKCCTDASRSVNNNHLVSIGSVRCSGLPGISSGLIAITSSARRNKSETINSLVPLLTMKWPSQYCSKPQIQPGRLDAPYYQNYCHQGVLAIEHKVGDSHNQESAPPIKNCLTNEATPEIYQTMELNKPGFPSVSHLQNTCCESTFHLPCLQFWEQPEALRVKGKEVIGKRQVPTASGGTFTNNTGENWKSERNRQTVTSASYCKSTSQQMTSPNGCLQLEEHPGQVRVKEKEELVRTVTGVPFTTSVGAEENWKNERNRQAVTSGCCSRSTPFLLLLLLVFLFQPLLACGLVASPTSTEGRNTCSSFRTSDTCLSSLQSCVWCDIKCTSQEDCEKERTYQNNGQPKCMNKPNGFVKLILPENGPLEGETILVLEGYLGQHKISNITEQVHFYVAGKECKILKWTSLVGPNHPWRAECETASTKGAVHSRVMLQIREEIYGDILSTFYSDETYTIENAVLHGMTPGAGPTSGGTTVTLHGTNLNIGRKRMIFLSGSPCMITRYNSTTIQCTTGPSDVTGPGPVTLWIDKDPVKPKHEKNGDLFGKFHYY